MMREIGSEFWLEYSKVDLTQNRNDVFPLGDDNVYVLSGRTAIDFILDDISTNVRSVYMPSYCCDSMLQPFVDRDIELYFYDVISSSVGLEYVVDHDKDVDLFFATSYFGYGCTTMDAYVETFKSRNIVVIEDITHRLLCERSHCKSADYLVSSLRKWFPIPSGGLAVKMNGRFRSRDLAPPPVELLSKKVRAMRKKAEYIKSTKKQNNEHDKRQFLELYSQFNQSLRFNYKRQGMDDLSLRLMSTLDISSIQTKRRSNAQYVYAKLENFTHIKPLIAKPDFTQDCPLFVPIMIRADQRDNLRDYLVRNNVFCPIHWPVSERVVLSPRSTILYAEELSLICDQRYSNTELEPLLNLLGEFETTI